MRILFDSRLLAFKDPFGTLVPRQECRLHIHIPVSVPAVEVLCCFEHEHGGEAFTVPMTAGETRGVYRIWEGLFHIKEPGLYFYYFYIAKPDGGFRLFKAGDGTNMEDGDKWQLSCVPADFTTPDWAKGAVIYQVFPDRFHASGRCDLTGKLGPYTVHERWDEEVAWQPTPDGKVLNNDFYGGNFRGITEKLDYIASLGVTVLYLNPISKSFSNHRYDTGDYKTPDPMLGTEEDFSHLCDEAHRRGIRVVLDGVYSHTGADSVYFNRSGSFPSVGAYNSPQSPYYSWYQFRSYPDSYTCWWDFDTLPTVNKLDPSFIDYIITGEDSVVAHYLRLGADGFRLDVVDELPNEFVALLKKRIRQLRPDALLIGEVWEDASNKVAYGIRRRYFVDGVLDSCMNYPFRTAILNYIKGADDGRALREAVLTVAENYPPQVVQCNMNMLGTHDTARILTALVDDFDGTREEKAARRLSHEDLALARQRLLLASVLQYTLPGAPSLYYADEAGMEGYKDPFNRRTYPWGREDGELLEHHRRLGRLRREAALRAGDVQFFEAADGRVGFVRSDGTQRLRVYVNCGTAPWELSGGRVLYSCRLQERSPEWHELAPMGFAITQED